MSHMGRDKHPEKIVLLGRHRGGSCPYFDPKTIDLSRSFGPYG